MILKIYHMQCDNCGKQYKEGFDEISELLKYSSMDGWCQKKVENGSIWEFCPKCLEKENKK